MEKEYLSGFGHSL